MTLLRDALTSLDGAGVMYAIRNAPERIDAMPAGDDLDVVVSSAQLADADRALRAAGLRRLRERGHTGHRFYVDCDADGQWIKVDLITRLRYGDEVVDAERVLDYRVERDGVWVASADDRARHEALRAAGVQQPVTLFEKVARQLPVGVRRRGAVVAVLGPDGAGKGSVIAALTRSLPVARTVVYFGQRPRHRVTSETTTAVPTPASAWRETAFVLRKAGSAWVLLARAYLAAWRGHVVLCDRHPLDVVAVRPRRTRVAAAIERAVVARMTPRPDAVITLDAAGEELFRRKHEHDPETLERWRQGYLAVAAGPRGRVVSSSGSLEHTVADVSQIIWETFATRNRWIAPDPADVLR